MGRRTLAEKGLESGDPIKPKEPLGSTEEAETPADDYPHRRSYR
ncbi:MULTISPECIES: hypothetical protein [Haloarcula]|nr:MULTISPECIES: hypothetical protein [Haloarcula]